MLIDNKEKVIKLTVDGYFRGTVTSFKGNDDEYYIIRDMITEFEAELRTWLQENEKDLISEQQKQFTDKLFYKILYWRMQGWILGEIVDHDLEYEIKKITKEKISLENDLSDCKGDVIRALNEVKERDKQITNLEIEIHQLGGGKI